MSIPPAAPQYPAPPTAHPAPPVKPKKAWYKRWWVWVIAALVLIWAIGALTGGGDDNDPAASALETVAPTEDVTEAPEEPAEEVAEPVVEEEPAAEEEPVEEVVEEAPAEPEPVEGAPAEPAEPAEPELTLGQQNAVNKAVSYLNYTAFSRSGLIEQLEFEDYSTEDATFAVDYVAPDWNEQAAAKAQNYLDYTEFSRQGLIDQLIFEGYTPEQAEHGATAVGY
ncbi:MAG: Ltp family lipoprotein [Microbacterium gubbeenense]|uniref:Ltp family lipoprotein n=1 Tax=Microbacterium gubbeenense TaxID=159896 RepID=UPI003F9B99E8